MIAHGKPSYLPVGDAHGNESAVSRLHAYFCDSAPSLTEAD